MRFLGNLQGLGAEIATAVFPLFPGKGKLKTAEKKKANQHKRRPDNKLLKHSTTKIEGNFSKKYKEQLSVLIKAILIDNASSFEPKLFQNNVDENQQV